MLVAVTTSPMMKACIPAPGGLFPESPRAKMVQVRTALPSSSVVKAVDGRVQSCGWVYIATPVEDGTNAPPSR